MLATEPKSVAEIPEWNYDGSSTNQAPGDDSEVILRPVAMYPDPFRGGNSKLVLCETFTPEGEALPTNSRAFARSVFDQCPGEKTWFGIEQEYIMFRDGTPLGWPRTSARSFGGPTVQIGYPGPQGPYYCSAGADVAFGRDLVETHLKACLYAGLTVSGINAEVMAGQWEYQVATLSLKIGSGFSAHVSPARKCVVAGRAVRGHFVGRRDHHVALHSPQMRRDVQHCDLD